MVTVLRIKGLILFWVSVVINKSMYRKINRYLIFHLILAAYNFLVGQVGYHESENELHMPLLDNMFKGAIIGRYNELLRSLAENMTSEIFNRMKNFVQGKTHYAFSK